jgi:hypothetical protein
MSEDEISSIRLTMKTKGRLNDERHGRESDDVLVNRLMDELKKLRGPGGK